MNVKCIPTKELYLNPISDFRILSCLPIEAQGKIELNKYGNFTVSGNNVNFKLNTPITLEIEPKKNAKYEGEYICVGYGGIEIGETGYITIPQEQEEAILCQFMTKSQADNVLKPYPNFVEMILNGQVEEIDVKKIYNVGNYRLAEYVEKIEKNCDMIFFNKDCWGLGITKDADIEKIRSRYKKSSLFIEAFNNNPYETMCDIVKFSFNKADPIILRNFPELESTRERCKYFCIDILKENEAQGDTKLNPSIIAKYLRDNMPELYPFVVDVIKNDERFYYDNKTKFCSLSETRRQEENIAEHILSCVERSKNNTGYDKEFVEQFRTIGDMSLTDEQMRILELMDRGWIAVLTGAGGSGKSSSTKALIRMLEAKGKSYTLLAPTGVSSKVLKQMTGRPACTIHMLLARQDPVGEYVVVDEASMITVKVLSDLFDYIGKDRKIVFVCDEDQLPSIGAGNIVHDIIVSGVVPVARLTKIFRYNSSGIITNVTDVRNGNFDHVDDEYPDFSYSESTNDIKQQLLNEYQRYLDMGYKKDDILILSPFRVTDSGSHAINNVIQAEYNNHPETEAKIRVDGFNICFKVGDRVINTKNNYHMPKWDIDNNSYEFYEDEDGNEYYTEMPVYNGDLGNIVDIRTDEDGKARIIVEWDNGFGCVEGSKIQNLLLGYCVTIHKCVTGDTLIYTNKGIKTIESIYENKNKDIKVYNGVEFEEPTNFVKNISMPCKTIALKNGAKITGTLDHGLTTVDKNGQLSRVNIGEVKEGDWLALRIGSNVYGAKIDLSEYKVRRDGRENPNIVIPNYLSEDLAVFLGIMCADGTVYKGGFRFAKRNEEVVDCAIKVAIKEFNVSPKKYYKIEKSRGKNGAWYGEVNSTGLSRWLLALGGLAPNNKYVPDCILESPKNIQKKFLRGLFEDGTVNIKKEKFDHIEFTTISQKCVYQVQTMLLNMGICSYVKKYGKREIFHLYIYRKDAIKFKEEIGFISFSKQERLDKYLKEYDIFHSCDNTYIPNIRELCKQAFDKIGKKQLSKKVWDAVHFYTSEITRGLVYKISENLINKDNELSNYLLFLYNNYMFFPVTNIKDCVEETYCFEMPKTHQFVQNGFMGWNCQGTQGKVVIVLVNKKGRDDFINRNILYVALSRAQEQLSIIANREIIEEGLEYQANLTRETWLEELLNE